MIANRTVVRIARLVALVSVMRVPDLMGQGRETPGRSDALVQMNDAIEGVVKRVSQSTVQVLVTSYGPVDATDRNNTDLIIGHQRSMGSGVVIDQDGYIMTNAHVLSNARRVEVILPGAPGDHAPVGTLARSRGRTVDARIVGVAREIDLALLKVEVADLPALPIADYDKLRQGELVFAFGSPEGLRNSVTMGIVSAVARQQDPDSPLVYVQTDAPINRGNSGGPLVNVKGELVGINTFIVSTSGGSQGLGFAIPSALVQMAYPKLRKFGHLHRGEIGLLLQTITPTIARGLGLSQESGALISDVLPNTPAAAAGLKVQDIIVSVDGQPVDGVPYLGFQFFTRSAGDRLKIGVIRGSDALTAELEVTERAHDFDRLSDLVDPEKSLVGRLGILGVDLNEKSAQFASGLRWPLGVMVVGHTKEVAELADTGLMTGDAIHGINGNPVLSVDDLRAALDRLQPRSAVVLQIERNGQMTFLGFEVD
jgi:serine protease Do